MISRPVAVRSVRHHRQIKSPYIEYVDWVFDQVWTHYKSTTLASNTTIYDCFYADNFSIESWKTHNILYMHVVFPISCKPNVSTISWPRVKIILIASGCLVVYCENVNIRVHAIASDSSASVLISAHHFHPSCEARTGLGYTYRAHQRAPEAFKNNNSVIVLAPHASTLGLC